MNLNIDNLIIEVTRKCNLKCEHCLRGESQRKTISDQHIYKMLQLFDSVNTLCITGGEPTLAMDSLKQIVHCIRYGNADVQNFYMVTNGKTISIDKVAEWAADMKECCSDNELSTIGFSFDSFHTDILNDAQLEKQKRNYYNLKEKLEYEYGIYENGWGADFITKHSDSNWGYENLISEGRAKGFGTRGNNISHFEIEDYGGETETLSINEEHLYLSANGYIVAGCDWSYDSIDNRKDIRIAHIDEIRCQDDLIQAIKTFNKKAEKILAEVA